MAGEPEWTRPEEHYSFQDGVPKVLVGELYGLRSFKVTDDGWLTGVSFPKPWAPGTNKSECWAVTAWEADGMHTTHKPRQVNLIHDNPDLPSWKKHYTAWEIMNDEGDFWTTRTCPTPLYEHQDDPLHNVGTCVCGLHGYLAGSLSYAVKPHRISGVVRAWGQMGVGARGFRAQYARIVALYLPPFRFDSGGGFHYAADEPNHRPPHPDVLVKVRNRYHLPIYRTLAELTAAHPTTPPPSKEPS